MRTAKFENQLNNIILNKFNSKIKKEYLKKQQVFNRLKFPGY